MTRNEKNYNKIIGVTTNKELVVLERTFEESEEFKGAVGYCMNILTQDYIDSMKSFRNADEEMWKDAVSSGITEKGFEEWWEELVEDQGCYGYLYPYDDNSFRYKTEQLYEELSDIDREKIEAALGVFGEDYITFSSSSCGRCFEESMKWEVLLEPQLWEEIKRVEHRKVKYCTKCNKEIGSNTNNCVYHFDNKEVCEECHDLLSNKEKEEKEARVQALVKNYLEDLPKSEVIDLFLDRVSSYKMQDICKKVTGDSSDWIYLKNQV